MIKQTKIILKMVKQFSILKMHSLSVLRIVELVFGNVNFCKIHLRIRY